MVAEPEKSIVKSTEAEIDNLRDLWRRRKAVCLLVLVIIVAPTTLSLYDRFYDIPDLRDKILQKGREIDRLNTELIPFRTVALQRFGGTEQEALTQLAAQLNELQTRLSAIQNYSEVAKLNFLGLTGAAGFGLIEHSPINDIVKDCYTNVGSLWYPLCTPEAQAKFLEAIDKFPDFPFSYYGIAVCYQASGKTNWQKYAVKAIGILDQTTTIKGHNDEQDGVRDYLRRLLSKAAPTRP